jgi:CofD-related protein of GAK system
MSRFDLTRTALLPDPLRVARCRRAPELGPKLLFFSGGTALRALSQRLVEYTHNSIHIVTPFDSGGSSAVLRRAFGMLAVGDVRYRIMALADRSVQGAPATFDLFAHRLPKDAAPGDLRAALDGFIAGRAKLVRAVPDPMRKIIRTHLGFFREHMPADFDLRGASIGNLILAGGFFNHRRHIDPVIYLFSKLVEARGVVRPVLAQDLHLAAELEDGTRIVGQHLLTGKEAAPIASPVRKMWLCRSLEDPEPVRPAIREKVRSLISEAELICYPMGSFHSSLLANLQPQGVGDAVAANGCPKVYIPNSAQDPEQRGLSLGRMVERLLEALRASCSEPVETGRLLNLVLLDSRRGAYAKPLELERIRSLGVDVLDLPLVSQRTAPLVDEELLIPLLLSLV